MTNTKKQDDGKAGSRGTILVLEDAEPSRNVIEYILKKNNYNVIGFENGKLALDQITSEAMPDVKLIFSDVMMPVMSGIEFVKKLKETNTLQDVPIIIMTAISDKEIIVEARKLGVTGYILKPVTAKKIVEVLKKVFPDETFTDFSAG